MKHIKQLISLFLMGLLIMCSKQKDINTHPWASFNKDSWVDVYSYHKMVISEREPSEWESNIRLTVLDKQNDFVIIRSSDEQNGIDDTAKLYVPLVDEFNGMRALGQWPHDIFPIGPERQSGITPDDKNPKPENIIVREVESNVEITIDGKTYSTVHYEKQWTTNSSKSGQRHFFMNVWKADNIELPLKWILKSDDGEHEEESKIIKLEEMIDIDGKQIPCIVTFTNKKLRGGGVLTKKRWTSSHVPGFMVKMESKMESKKFSLEVQEHITKFSI